MIESYEGRLKHSLLLYNNVVALLLTRKNSAVINFDMAYDGVKVSSDMIAHYNMKTRKDFTSLDLDFGTQTVSVTIYNESVTLLFSHAMNRAWLSLTPIAHQLLSDHTKVLDA